MDYQRAKDIRGKSFSSLLIDSIVKGGGVGSSLSKTISEKTQANVQGIKQTFDPLQIAKTLTFGSNFAPAVLGRVLGRSKEDIKFFTGRTRKRGSSFVSALDNSASGIGQANPAVALLGGIYDLLVKQDELRKQDILDREKEFKREEKYAELYNKELIKALTARRKKEKKVYPDKKDEIVKEPEAETPKPPTPKSKTPKKTKPAPTTPKPTAPTAPKPTAPKPTAPTAPKPTAPKSLPTSKDGVKSPISTAAKVAGAAVLGTTVTSAIGASESGGDYNTSFGDRFDKKSGKMVNFAKDPKTGKPLNLMTPEEFSGGKKLTEMTLEEVKAFGEYRSQNGAGAGAVGKYQFMPTTLFGRVDKQGKYIPGLVAQLKIPMNTEFSGPVQERLQELLRTQDVNALKRAGIPITPGYEYMAHYIGAGGTTAVYNSIKRGENKTVAEVMTDAGFSIGNNRELYEIRAIDFEKELQGRLEKKGKLTPHSFAGSGEQIDTAAKENRELRESLNKDKRAQDTVTNNITTNTSQKSEEREETADDKPAFMKKRRM